MLKLENVSYKVKNGNEEKVILKDINLCFEKNQITVITGHNGSGKSSLVKIIMGINEISEGKILFNGKDITNSAIDERANLGLTFAFQQPIKFKGLTVKDLLNVSNNKENNVNTLCDYLSRVGLCAREYINREIDSSLSGGELKRIELAMALAKDDEVLIFDEPEAGIDLWSFDNLTNLFKNFKGKTIIIVSHQEKILRLANQIVLLKGKDNYVCGTKEEILPLINLDKCEPLKRSVNE